MLFILRLSSYEKRIKYLETQVDLLIKQNSVFLDLIKFLYNQIGRLDNRANTLSDLIRKSVETNLQLHEIELAMIEQDQAEMADDLTEQLDVFDQELNRLSNSPE